MRIEKSWYEEMREELALDYIQELKAYLAEEKRAGKVVYPPEELVFNAFLHVPFQRVKVVIIGQDPYHGPNQAHGLSFSVPYGVKPPPSLKNIFKEIEDDLHITLDKEQGNLTSWADQGVLLLNATLTVRQGEPRSHYGRGWERFTDAVVKHLIQRKDPVIFVLWGKSAQEKYEHISSSTGSDHRVLVAAHPSPYSASAGFFCCRHFSKINEQLVTWGKSPIDWHVTRCS